MPYDETFLHSLGLDSTFMPPCYLTACVRSFEIQASVYDGTKCILDVHCDSVGGTDPTRWRVDVIRVSDGHKTTEYVTKCNNG